MESENGDSEGLEGRVSAPQESAFPVVASEHVLLAVEALLFSTEFTLVEVLVSTSQSVVEEHHKHKAEVHGQIRSIVTDQGFSQESDAHKSQFVNHKVALEEIEFLSDSEVSIETH